MYTYICVCIYARWAYARVELLEAQRKRRVVRQPVRERACLRVQGLGFRVWGLGFRVWGLGFRVWGLGLRVGLVKRESHLPMYKTDLVWKYKRRESV